MNITRKDLGKYYKYVLVCKTCNKEFGVDAEKCVNGLCPICESKTWKNRDHKFMGIIGRIVEKNE